MSSPAFRDLEIVRIRPLAGARNELLALRPQLVAEYRAAFGDRFSAVLSEEAPDNWVDIWQWVDRADAEHALANRTLVPSFDRWEQLVEVLSLRWATIVA